MTVLLKLVREQRNRKLDINFIIPKPITRRLMSRKKNRKIHLRDTFRIVSYQYLSICMHNQAEISSLNKVMRKLVCIKTFEYPVAFEEICIVFVLMKFN